MQLAALLLALASVVGAQEACPVAPPVSPLPDPLPAATQAAITALQDTLQSLFVGSGVTAGVATLVLDQSQVMTYTFGTTRANGTGSPITGAGRVLLKVCVCV
jgi:hypothetical protein